MIENSQQIKLLKQDCFHFKTDRPCEEHKKNRVLCSHCPCYKPVSKHILIIKLEAIGDVLRTTFLLSILEKQYPSAKIDWVCKEKSKPVLENIPSINQIITSESNLCNLVLNQFHFDFVFNLDLSLESLLLATKAKATEKVGFLYLENSLVGSNEAANYLLATSLSDKLKNENSHSYQSMIASICEIPYNLEKAIVPITKSGEFFAKDFVENSYPDKKKGLIGLNIGCGSKWPNKKWDLDNWFKLAKTLLNENYGVIFFLGPNETNFEAAIKKENFVHTSPLICYQNSCALINMTDGFVSGDTLLMHAALGLSVPTIALFGPTSSSEIEVYNNGRKIKPNNNCSTCYDSFCEKNCINSITVKEVYEELNHLIDAEK